MLQWRTLGDGIKEAEVSQANGEQLVLRSAGLCKL